MGLIRFLLAISVVVFHANSTLFGFKFNGGTLAVQLFFIISGFYMSLILNEKYTKQANSYFLFISNRMLRLYPLYFTVAIIILVIYIVDYHFFHQTSNWVGEFFSYANRLNKISLFYIISSNSIILGQDLALFLGVDPITGGLFFTQNFKATEPQLNRFMILGQAWTVGLEITFYLVAPFLVRRQIITVIVLILGSLLLRLFIYYGLHMKYDPWTYRFFPTELTYFLFGYLCYKAYKYVAGYDLNKKAMYFLWILLSVLTISYGNIFSTLKDIHLYQTLFHKVYTLLFIISLPFIFILTKNMSIDNQIGELSYPIYLCHSLPLYINSRLGMNNVYFVAFWTIILSVLLNYFIANPIEIIRQKRVPVRK